MFLHGTFHRDGTDEDLAVCRICGAPAVAANLRYATCPNGHRALRLVDHGETVQFRCLGRCRRTVVIDSYDQQRFGGRRGLYCPNH